MDAVECFRKVYAYSKVMLEEAAMPSSQFVTVPPFYSPSALS